VSGGALRGCTVLYEKLRDFRTVISTLFCENRFGTIFRSFRKFGNDSRTVARPLLPYKPS